MTNFRIGFGSDVHRLVEGKKLILGGVEIPAEKGAEGHSDADALAHAITDALLGALALGDIGSHFPDNEERWQNADSFVFLRYALGLIKEKGFAVANVDSVVHLEKPKIREFVDRMRGNIATALEIEIERVGVKAKTGEKLGAVGLELAIKCEAVVLLQNARKNY
jgi:2-C-methyl-D-erythritol 2,4-cyclodiphosphate synthase